MSTPARLACLLGLAAALTATGLLAWEPAPIPTAAPHHLPRVGGALPVVTQLRPAKAPERTSTEPPTPTPKTPQAPTAPPPGEAEPTPGGRVSIKLAGPRLAGATIIVRRNGTRLTATTCGPEGRAELEELQPGLATLVAVTEDGTFSAETPIAISPFEKTTVELTLRRTPRLEGRITTSSGAPLAGVTVSINEEGPDGFARTTVSDPEGHFSAPAREGSHRLVVSEAGLHPICETGIVMGPIGRWLELTAQVPATLAGTLVGAHGEPVAGTVSLYEATTGGARDVSCDASGRFQLLVPPGTYRITGRLGDIDRCCGRFSRFRSVTVTVRAGALIANIDVPSGNKTDRIIETLILQD